LYHAMDAVTNKTRCDQEYFIIHELLN